MDKEQKQTLVETYHRHETDTGSAAVQIALLTQRINELTEHLKQHTQDHHSRRGLLQLVSRRKRLLAYLARTDKESYLKLLSQLGLRKKGG